MDTVCAFSFVLCKTNWTIKNRKSAPLPLRIIVKQIKDKNFYPKPTVNKAPKEDALLTIMMDSSFKCSNIFVLKS